MAGTSTITPDWAPVAHRIREEATDFWNDKVAVDQFTGKGGHFVRGRARITCPREITVAAEDGTRVFRARRGIVIATGGGRMMFALLGGEASGFLVGRGWRQAR
jgi:pyruvate/2-oxoglutarate dehydrogenase complex dihydrolipoamide dehydrogenase (E3) component